MLLFIAAFFRCFVYALSLGPESCDILPGEPTREAGLAHLIPNTTNCWVFEPRGVAAAFRCAETCAQIPSVTTPEIIINHPYQFLCRTCQYQNAQNLCTKRRTQECYPSSWDCCRAYFWPEACLAANYSLTQLTSYELMIESCRFYLGSYAAPWCYLAAMFPMYHCGKAQFLSEEDLVTCVTAIVLGNVNSVEGAVSYEYHDMSLAMRGPLFASLNTVPSKSINDYHSGLFALPT